MPGPPRHGPQVIRTTLYGHVQEAEGPGSGARKGTCIGFAIATLVFATADGSFGDETEAIQVVGSYEFKFQVRMALQLIEDELPHTER